MMPQRAGCDRRKTENNGDASLAHSDDLCRRQRGLRARHRGQSGAVPLFSTLLVAVMLIVSMLLFARLVQRLSDLQITSVLQLIGDKGREVIRDTFQRLRAAAEDQDETSRTSRRRGLWPDHATHCIFG